MVPKDRPPNSPTKTMMVKYPAPTARRTWLGNGTRESEEADLSL